MDRDSVLHRALSQTADHRGEVLCPTVVEVVAVDRGHDHVLEAERRRRRGDAGWFGQGWLGRVGVGVGRVGLGCGVYAVTCWTVVILPYRIDLYRPV